MGASGKVGGGEKALFALALPIKIVSPTIGL